MKVLDAVVMEFGIHVEDIELVSKLLVDVVVFVLVIVQFNLFGHKDKEQLDLVGETSFGGSVGHHVGLLLCWLRRVEQE